MIVRFTLVLVLALAPALGETLSPIEPHVVNLWVMAGDKDGNPVKDLTSDDFQVVDDGIKQKVYFLRYDDNSLRPMPSLGSGQLSNRVTADIPHATVILFDLLNENFNDRAVLLNEIVEGLSKLDTADDLYLYILTEDGKLFAIHGFPETAYAFRPASADPWTRQIKPLMDQAMRTVTSLRPKSIDLALRAQLTFQALNRLGMELSRVPGHKNLVWIGAGAPNWLGPKASDTNRLVDFTPLVGRLGVAFERLDITVYPVRAIGAIYTLAGETGGRLEPFKAIGAVITQAIEDVRRPGCWLVYNPPPQDWNDKFHEIKVSCERKGTHISLLNKTGYYAQAEAPGAQAQRAFEVAASTTFDAAGIGLIARMSRDAQDDGMAHLELRIEAHDVALVPDGTDYVAQLRLLVVHDLAAGTAWRSPVVPLNLRYSAEQREKVLNQGIDFAQNVPLGQKGDRIRFIVFDQGSNSFGSVTVPANAIPQSR
jgi:VWFA-related protein